MQLPEIIKQICQQYFEEIKKDPFHIFNPPKRLEFYYTFEAENYAETSKFLEYLQFLAAQHILPIWEQTISEEYYALPNQLIALAEDVLTGKVSRESKILELLIDEGYHLFGNLEYDDHAANVLNAGETTYSALSSIKYEQPYKKKKLAKNVTDEDLRDGEFDPTGLAVLAFAAICKDNYPTGKLDPDKSLEFWEWWFFEAIPQAWDLANQNQSQ